VHQRPRVAQRLNVALKGRLEDMRKALSEYYSETENDPQLDDIWAELEATYHDRAGPSITLTSAEGENLVASLSFDNMQNEAHRRESSQRQTKINQLEQFKKKESVGAQRNKNKKCKCNFQREFLYPLLVE